MNFRFSNHAMEEMHRRNIPLNVVESVLHSPEQIVEERDGRKAYQSQIDFGGAMFLVRVLVVDDVDPAIVITVYRTSRISKYWR
jgi:hypothetical protein